MAVTLVATVGASNSNSYCTLSEAETYHDTRLHNSDWNNASAPDKTIALIWSTRLLDEWFDWQGTKVGLQSEQALRWPRYGAYYRDGEAISSDIIPQFLKDAASELAKDLIAGDPTADSDTKGFSEMRVDVLMLKIDKADRDSTTVISDAVKSMLEPFGTLRTRGGSSSVRLLRA